VLLLLLLLYISLFRLSGVFGLRINVWNYETVYIILRSPGRRIGPL